MADGATNATGSSRAGDRPDAARTGLLMMAGATLLIPCIDAIAKILINDTPAIPAVQIAFFRFLAQIALLAPLAFLTVGWRVLKPRRFGLMALRGLLIAGAGIFFFASLKAMPLAETVAIFFVEPLLLTALSAALLGERIGWRRISAVLVGLAGAMLIVRPSFIEVGWAATLPFGAAVCFALYLLLTKILAEESAFALQFWSAVSALVVMTLAMGLGVLLLDGAAGGIAREWLAPAAPTPRQWALLALLGLIATSAHMVIVFAFQRAPASLLAPFQYLEIVGATTLGWLVFGEFPDPATPAGQATWAGVLLVVGSGLFVFARERRLENEGAPPA
ncbi:MAG: DMT family transporter [Pseudomonadota bacterium]